MMSRAWATKAWFMRCTPIMVTAQSDDVKCISRTHIHTKLTSTELRLLWDPEVLTIQ